MKTRILSSIVFGALLAVSGFGQTTAPADKDGKVAARKETQQKRIGNGVKSGELTAGETARLENKEKNINKETRADRAADGGKLTAAEKAKVNRQQNRVSKDIYKDKHNTVVQPK